MTTLGKAKESAMNTRTLDTSGVCWKPCCPCTSMRDVQLQLDEEPCLFLLSPLRTCLSHCLIFS